MLAVISSQESTRQIRQWRGFGFVDSDSGAGATTGVTGDVTAVSMDIEKLGFSVGS